MRALLSILVLSPLLACSPPAERSAEAPAPQTDAPPALACNQLAPGPNAIALIDEPALAAAAADLRGGRIVPGVYDLTRGVRIGDGGGWDGARAVAMDVREAAEGGVIVNWASVGAGETERWTGVFSELPSPNIAFTCGRSGSLGDVDFSATLDSLTLRLPNDSADGGLQLDFARRAGG